MKIKLLSMLLLAVALGCGEGTSVKSANDVVLDVLVHTQDRLERAHPLSRTVIIESGACDDFETLTSCPAYMQNERVWVEVWKRWDQTVDAIRVGENALVTYCTFAPLASAYVELPVKGICE